MVHLSNNKCTFLHKRPIISVKKIDRFLDLIFSRRVFFVVGLDGTFKLFQNMSTHGNNWVNLKAKTLLFTVQSITISVGCETNRKYTPH